jgi:hypothetical protein
MSDLEAPPIPYLTDDRLLTRERHLVDEIATCHRRRQRRRLALGGAAAVASGATAALVVSLGAGTPPAFAAWTPSPTTPTPGQLAAAERTCAARPTDPPPGVPALPTKVSLADTRGPFSLLLFGANTTIRGVLLCMSGPDGTQLSVATGHQLAAPRAGQITLDRLQAQSAHGQPYTVAEGSTGSNVSAATLTLSNGSRVDTTVGNRLFLAWWPGSATVTSASMTSASMTSTQPITSPPRDTGGAASISGGPANPSIGSVPHTAAQRAELQRFCAHLRATYGHRPDGPPIGPCAALGS